MRCARDFGGLGVADCCSSLSYSTPMTQCRPKCDLSSSTLSKGTAPPLAQDHPDPPGPPPLGPGAGPYDTLGLLIDRAITNHDNPRNPIGGPDAGRQIDTGCCAQQDAMN